MYINWKSNDTPISELTLENFRDFCEDFAEYTYLLCYKATLDDKLADSYSVLTLCNVLCQESAKDGGSQVMPEEGIKNSLINLLSKAQLSNLYNDSIKPEETKIPLPELCDSIINRAVSKAAAEMPRYAPVYSGTKGTMVILGIVVIIIAAILLIWTNPFSCVQDPTGNNAGIAVPFVDRPNPDLLVDIDCRAETGDFNCGAVPVLVTIGGPDLDKAEKITVSGTDANGSELYECGIGEYCFFADTPGTYGISVSGNKATVSHYQVIPDVNGTGDDLPFDSYIAVSHNDTAVITQPSDAQIKTHPKKGSLTKTSSGYEYAPKDALGCVGLDSVTVELFGGRFYTLPIIISNASPVTDTATLSVNVRHTPTKAGSAAGYIKASDADGDALTFKLVSTKGCKVLLAPNGGYIAKIDKDNSTNEASFVFTVSDGLVTTAEMVCSFVLINRILPANSYSADFVCYGGSGGYYDIPLPARDEDGDPLTWRLVSANSNGFTESRNSHVLISSDGIKYRVDSTLNEDFTEELEFTCSDGWISSGVITFTCKVKKNNPPVSTGMNLGAMPADGQSATFTLSVKDDCPFDVCRITGVLDVHGGEVVENEGWNDLKFTFRPDGTDTLCYARLRVEDTITGEYSIIRFDITVS